jgi:hypothetical protein
MQGAKPVRDQDAGCPKHRQALTGRVQMLGRLVQKLAQGIMRTSAALAAGSLAPSGAPEAVDELVRFFEAG